MPDKQTNRILGILGLAKRAGKLKSGEFSTENLLKAGKAALVLAARDASDNTIKKFRDKCRFYHVPFTLFGTKEELGHATGTELRSSLAVEYPGFAEAILKLLEEYERN